MNLNLIIAAAAIAFALIVGAGYAYEHHGTVRYEVGKKEILDKWRESDRIALEVGAAKTAMSARDAIRNTEKLNAKLAALSTHNATLATDNRGLRVDLAAIAAAPASSAVVGPTCRSYEVEYRSCAGLLGEGFGLAGEGSGLALDIATRLDALQDDARSVRSTLK